MIVVGVMCPQYMLMVNVNRLKHVMFVRRITIIISFRPILCQGPLDREVSYRVDLEQFVHLDEFSTCKNKVHKIRQINFMLARYHNNLNVDNTIFISKLHFQLSVFILHFHSFKPQHQHSPCDRPAAL